MTRARRGVGGRASALPRELTRLGRLAGPRPGSGLQLPSHSHSSTASSLAPVVSPAPQPRSRPGALSQQRPSHLPPRWLRNAPNHRPPGPAVRPIGAQVSEDLANSEEERDQAAPSQSSINIPPPLGLQVASARPCRPPKRILPSQIFLDSAFDGRKGIAERRAAR